jgi:3-hydroxyisobutyrate dehydrogenase-like beta-hydroxyacid dehydrogenase
MDSKTVGMIGLGLMGTALTQRLLEAGYAVHVYNRTREKAGPLIAVGAQWADNPLAVCDRVLISLYTTETVEAVLAQMDDALRPGQILVDTTTGDPEQTERLGARLAQRGAHYLDAPISGSSVQTRRGEVTTMVGGCREAFDACRDLFECFSQKTFHVGPCGSAAKMKLVSNLVLGLNRAAMAEGLALAQAMGLDPEDALAVLMGSMAYSRIMDTKGRKMVDGDFRTQAKLSQHLKDVRLILEAAASAGLAAPLSEAHRRLLEAAEAAGYGESDNSAVIRAYDLEQKRT